MPLDTSREKSAFMLVTLLLFQNSVTVAVVHTDLNSSYWTLDESKLGYVCLLINLQVIYALNLKYISLEIIHLAAVGEF